MLQYNDGFRPIRNVEQIVSKEHQGWASRGTNEGKTKRARALSAGARTTHNYGMSAQRPQSARPAFSSREYEEAKRRVRRLDATVAGVGAGAAERRDAAPLRADGARPAAGIAVGVAGAAGTNPLPLPPRKADAAQRDADFVANLRRNIAELRECIIGRLTPYPQLQVSRFAHTCASGSTILSYLCSREHSSRTSGEHYTFIFVLPGALCVHICAPCHSYWCSR